MLPELSEIKKNRKSFSLTQIELAEQTKVSQSLIAKIEADSIVPSYENAKKLFDFFETLHQKQEAKASEFMQTKVISVKPETPLRLGIKTMERHSISQLPVIDNGKNIGTISEKSVLEKISESGDKEKLLEKDVSEVMEEAMPQITDQTPFEVCASLTNHNPGILVVKKGKIIGIITKSDLLKAVVSK